MIFVENPGWVSVGSMLNSSAGDTDTRMAAVIKGKLEFTLDLGLVIAIVSLVLSVIALFK